MSNRLLDVREAVAVRDQLRSRGLALVFTNGCFDLLHVGHVRYLAQARALGDALLIGLNSDDSARKLKGPSRPVQMASDRAEVLLALRSVDYVILFDEMTAERLVGLLHPDIYVKGGDYDPAALEGPRAMPESRIVRGYGGRVVIIPFVPGYSTTEILHRAKREGSGEGHEGNA